MLLQEWIRLEISMRESLKRCVDIDCRGMGMCAEETNVTMPRKTSVEHNWMAV